jgi:mono/diheme cytochrome c family protein
MTRNILIATIFTFLTSALLGGIFIWESRRLPTASAAVTAEQIERGARDFEQYCAACHGLAGGGGVQFAAPPLNNIVQRYQESGQFDAPNGIKAKYGSMRNYIESIIFSGIRGTPMPAWGQPQGPLRDDQIRNIASYILSWNGQLPDAAVQTASLYATQRAPTPEPFVDPVRQGQVVFEQKGCVACHNMNDEDLVGPGLGGLFQPEGTAAFGTQLPNGKEVTEENVREWVELGSPGFEESIPSETGVDYPPMPSYPLTDEEWEDLLVWLKAHTRDGSLTEEAQQIIKEAQEGAPEGVPAEPSPQPTSDAPGPPPQQPEEAP